MGADEGSGIFSFPFTEIKKGFKNNFMAFLVFEGLDGSGKSTLIEALSKELSLKKIPFKKTREPGGTPLGEKVRSLLLQKDKKLTPTPWTELFLYEACRSQNVDQVIAPALKEGNWVLCDRFWASTTAFQAGGRSLDEKKVLSLNLWASKNIKPDLWILLDLSLEAATKRWEDRTAFHPLDRFELETLSFHEKVRESYLKISKTKEHGPWLVLDASQSKDVLMKQLMDELKKRKWLS